ncbi:hypothetical protein EBR66_07310 [bacterium]|nr:hypothetical protein [bacterium]
MNTIEDIRRAMENPKYHFARLDQYNRYNNKKDLYQKKCAEILRDLEDRQKVPSMAGTYTVKLTQDKNEKIVRPDEYKIFIGNETQKTMSEPGINIPHDFGTAMNHPAVKLQAEIATLKINNEALESEVAVLMEENERLNAEIEELTEQLKNQPQLSEQPEPDNFGTAKTMFTELLSVGAPLLDKWFDLQQEKNNILKQQYTPQQPIKMPVPQKLPIEQKIERWINSKADDTELFNNLQAIYFNSSDFTKFGQLLKDFNEDLYNECKQAVR